MSEVYVDTSAALRVIVELGTSPELELKLKQAEVVVTSRLAMVEAARTLIRLRRAGRSEGELAKIQQELEALWARSDVLDLTPAICELACSVAPTKVLRTLDALHLASYLVARRRFPALEMLTADARLQAALG